MIEQKLQQIGKPVFSVADVRIFLGANSTYARLLVHRLAKKGALVRLGGGRYCFKGTDVFVVASNMVFPSYVSFLSALRFHGATTQLPSVVSVACAKSKASLNYEGSVVEFAKISSKKLFGFRRVRVGNGFAFVADLEKAIVDCSYLPRRGSISEAFRAANAGGFDAGKLAEYALGMESGVVLKRVGFLLEKLGVDKSAEWKSKFSRKYDLLDPTFPRKGVKNKKWNLLVNRVLE